MALHRDLLHDYARVLIRPRAFFEKRPAPSAIEGGIAVFVVALVIGLASIGLGFVVSGLFRSHGYPDAASAVWSAILTVGISGTLGVFLVWIASAVVMHLLATVTSGGASIDRTLGVTGYGMLPSVLSTVIGFGFVYFTLQAASLSGSPEAAAAEIQRVMSGGGVLRELLDWGFLAWQAAIWTFGLRRVHEIPLAKAAMAAGIVGIGYGLLG